VLLTKLHIPSTGPEIVNRSKLINKLNQSLDKKLTLISAPAGFGKTTILVDWINNHKIPAVWFSIDKTDNDPVTFSNYIIAAFQKIENKLGINAQDLLKSSQLSSIESAINLLINELLVIEKKIILVLDDFHLINNIEIFRLLTYFLEHIPNNIHLIISTRSDPSLPVAKLRSQHQLVEIRSSDLSFSSTEINQLFKNILKINLSAEDISTLENKTEGWIAGLQLTAISLQGRENKTEFIRELAGDNRFIMDYLIEEVLRIQSDDIKEFLLKTSILEQFSAPLCNTITGRKDTQLIIEDLERNNMFLIPLDNERQWYRYHHLFADLLQQRLLLFNSYSIEELHNKACEWFEQNNMPNNAIEHALETNNFEKSIQLLGEVVEKMWKNGQHAAIMKYGDLLPDEFIKKNPEFCLYYSWILITAGQIQKAEPFLASAEIITQRIIAENNLSKQDIHSIKKLLGKIAVAFAYLYSHEEHTEKIFDYCKIAMENLTDDDPLWFSWSWFSYGIAYLSNGELVDNEAFEKALMYGKKSGNIYLITTIVIRLAENEQQLGHYKSAYTKCSNLLALLKDKGYSEISKTEWTFAALYFNIGITHFMWAEMDEAYENIKIAYNLCKSGKDIYLKIFILMFYTFMLLNRGEKEAVERINELDDIIKQNQIPPFLMSMYIGWKIYVLLHTKQIDQANNIILEYGLGLDKKKTHANEAAYSSFARLLIAQNKLDDAEFLLSELYTIANEGERIERLIEIKISMAIMHKKKGNHELAVANLMEAMELASDENLISMFVYNIEDIIDLSKDLYKIQATTKNKISNEFIRKFKLMIEKMPKRVSVISNSDLSSRELDTLKLVAENLSNQEIADKLFISLNTVKTHLKHINLKLEENSRNKAVSKAKELGII
jgi:LuxR family transcriptional regulator, maltose regulon positive regulatory protein